VNYVLYRSANLEIGEKMRFMIVNVGVLLLHLRIC